jgi:hypothetical protein
MRHLGGFFMLKSRRGFLIGAGSLLTAAFVKDARSFISTSGHPLLAQPKQVAQTMYWYAGGVEEEDGYLLTLGPWTMEPPPRPTWREFFVSQGIPHQTPEQLEKLCFNWGIEPGNFDKKICERYWWDRFECEDGPWAKAYRLLEKIDLGPDRASGRGPLLEFHEGDAHPGDDTIRVNARDKLSLSLLQARLIDLKLPIKIVEGT